MLRPAVLAVCCILCAPGGCAPDVVRLGGLFPRFRTAASDYSKDLSGIRRYVAFVQAIQEINNKTDGIADNLLPNTRIEFTQRDSKRDDATAFFEARELVIEAFGGQGVDAVVGAASSGPSSLAALATRSHATCASCLSMYSWLVWKSRLVRGAGGDGPTKAPPPEVSS